MKASTLKKEIIENEKITITIAGYWELIKNENSLLGGLIIVKHVHNIDKWNEFENASDAAKFFMKKLSATKSFMKKRGISIEDFISIEK